MQSKRDWLRDIDSRPRTTTEALGWPIAQLGLDERTVIALEREFGAIYCRDLFDLLPQGFLQGANLGPRTLAKVRAALRRVGFHSGGWTRPT